MYIITLVIKSYGRKEDSVCKVRSTSNQGWQVDVTSHILMLFMQKGIFEKRQRHGRHSCDLPFRNLPDSILGNSRASVNLLKYQVLKRQTTTAKEYYGTAPEGNASTPLAVQDPKQSLPGCFRQTGPVLSH